MSIEPHLLTAGDVSVCLFVIVSCLLLFVCLFVRLLLFTCLLLFACRPFDALPKLTRHLKEVHLMKLSQTPL